MNTRGYLKTGDLVTPNRLYFEWYRKGKTALLKHGEIYPVRVVAREMPRNCQYCYVTEHHEVWSFCLDKVTPDTIMDF